MKATLLLLLLLGCCPEPKNTVVVKVAPPTEEEILTHYDAGVRAGLDLILAIGDRKITDHDEAMTIYLNAKSNYLLKAKQPKP